MRFWITTHYPHYDPDEVPWNLYIRRAHRNDAAVIRAGDQIAFYEMKTAPPIVGKGKRPTGRQGIVCLAVADGPIQASSLYEMHVDGSVGDYAWEIPCVGHQWGRLVDRATVCRILDYNPNYTMRGLNGGRGFLELSRSRFEEIQEVFRRSI